MEHKEKRGKKVDLVSERLHRIRKAMGLSVGDAAALCGVSVSWWHDRRKGQIKPNPGTVTQVCSALALNENWVMTGAGTEPDWKLLPIVASQLRPRRNVVREVHAQYGTEPRVAAIMGRSGDPLPAPQRNLASAVRDLAAFLGTHENVVWDLVKQIIDKEKSHE